MSDELLSVSGLGVTYRSARRGWRRTTTEAVDDVSFAIAAGEAFGLVGESGAGKSTVGRAVLGLTAPTAGRVMLDGVDVAGADRRSRRALRRVVQAVFQDPTASLNPARTVGDSLREPLRLHRGLRGAPATAAAAELCERVGLAPDVLERLPAQLSGGQRQRAAIARALAPEPRLVVCDEPITALDVSTQAQVVNLFADLRDETGVALLFVSHDLSVVRHLSDRVGVMYAGRLVETGPTELVCDSPAHPYTAALLAAVPLLDPSGQRRRRADRRAARAAAAAARARGGDPSPARDSCLYAARCPRASDRCRGERPALSTLPDGRSVACHHPLTAPAPAGDRHEQESRAR